MRTSELAVVLARHEDTNGYAPSIVADYAYKLSRKAQWHRAMCERECNEPIADTASFERSKARVQRDIVALAADFELKVNFENDPRGCTVVLVNTQGQEVAWLG